MNYAFDSFSSSYSIERGVEEEDPTPKPLRITKRAKQPSSEDALNYPSAITPIHRLSFLGNTAEATTAPLQKDCSMVRLRHSSEIVSRASSTDSAAGINGNTQMALDRPRSPVAALGHHAAGALTVRKQRQRGTTSSSSGTGSTVAEGLHDNLLSYHPVQLNARNLQQLNQDHIPQRSQVGRERPALRARRILERAVTEQRYWKPEASNSSSRNSGSFVTSASRLIVSENKARAASERVSRSIPQPSLVSQDTRSGQLEGGLTRKPSRKHRLLSRMKNGISSQGATTQATIDRGRSRQESQGRFRTRREATSGTHHGRARSSMTSSDESTTTMGTEIDLDTALAAFPAPPRSSLKSPSVTFATPITPSTSPPTPSLPRVLRAPEDITIMGAKVTVIPEISSLSTDGGRSIFAAVGIEGIINAPVGRGISSADRLRLDVAVIIDNSLFSSPAALMSSCEITTYLSSLLDSTTDRLAVLCTKGSRMDEFGPRLLLPLGPIRPRKVKSIVDRVESSHYRNKPDVEALQRSLEMAKEVLMEPRSEPISPATPSAVTVHLFLLTANLKGVPPRLLEDDKIQIHLVHPGSVPWKGQEDIRVNGWRFRTMPFLRAGSAVSTRKDEFVPSNDLPALLAHARLGKSSGALSDLILEVKAGPGCTIEGVMGKNTLSSLHAGEKILALVRLKIGTIPMIASALADVAPDITSPSSLDLLQELDIMLGETSTPILTAKLRYKHSLLPADAHVSVKTEARLKSHISQLEAKRSPSDPPSPGSNERQTQVQKHLVFYLATHHSPRDALATLREQFGENGCRSICPGYIQLVTEELRYQARITERFDLQDDARPGKAQSPYEHFGEGLFDVENYRPQDWITIPDDIPRPITAINRKASSTLSPKEPKETDEARKIWGDLRRNSRGQTGFEVESGNVRKVSVQSKSEEEKIRRIRELALRNKRSVGADTLKSFAVNSGRTVGTVAPWM